MKLTIERAALLKSLTHVQSVVERRNTIPILSNVLIEADGDALSLTATDMDLTVVDKLAAEVSQGGATTAPAHTLYDIVRKLPEGAQVSIETARGTIPASPCRPAARFSPWRPCPGRIFLPPRAKICRRASRCRRAS